MSKLNKFTYFSIVKLLPGYRGYVIDRLQYLFSLDDKPINKEERINFQDFKFHFG